ncbi:MAG: hypothetical protein WC394_04465 [Candidatus Omnitrophota bacterium]|jgi:hypothetical protein
MERRVASKILIRSIIFSLTIPIPNTELFKISGKASSRSKGDNFLESSIRALKLFDFNNTAAETTGPAKGPLPASSTPIIKLKPFFLNLRS